MRHRYHNRTEAGRALAAALLELRDLKDPIVVALPRGGVPVAAQVAQAIGAPLEILTVRKIGAPGNRELACGAVTADGSTVWNERVLFSLGLTQGELRRNRERALLEAKQLEEALRSDSTPAISACAKTAVLVDDGLATGATMKAALKSILSQKPHNIIVAVPVAAEDICAEIEEMGYQLTCPKRLPEGELSSVGEWYVDFSQVESATCKAIFAESRAAKRDRSSAAAASSGQSPAA
jgi:putative phosphoribosyl transferase